MTDVSLKYCGIMSSMDLELTVKSQADYLGFNFFKDSRRYVIPAEASKWIQQISHSINQTLVGVFVNPSISEIEAVLKAVPLQVIQCHGDESPDQIKAIKQCFPCRIWKALRVTARWKEEAQIYLPYVDGILLDANVKGHYGGTGKTFDWAVIPEFFEFIRNKNKIGWIAGGISSSNLDQLLAYHPEAVDLASGIEMNYKKSASLIKEIEEKVKRYENSTR